LVRALNPAANSMRWHHPTVTGALATIAQDAVTLFGEPTQRSRIRRCENGGCRVVFYDDSRPGLRRWCASNRCGDRMRARLYRARHKGKLVGS
jgi:predicted RNA-binding Zn ribbon-like protein